MANESWMNSEEEIRRAFNLLPTIQTMLQELQFSPDSLACQRVSAQLVEQLKYCERLLASLADVGATHDDQSQEYKRLLQARNKKQDIVQRYQLAPAVIHFPSSS